MPAFATSPLSMARTKATQPSAIAAPLLNPHTVAVRRGRSSRKKRTSTTAVMANRANATVAAEMPSSVSRLAKNAANP